MEGFTCGYIYFPKGGLAGSLVDAGPPWVSRGKAPVGGLGTKSPKR